MISYSSISVWVKNCEKLVLPDKEKDELDKFIDKLYEDLDRGRFNALIVQFLNRYLHGNVDPKC